MRLTPTLHQHQIRGNQEERGFGMKVCATADTGRINRSQVLQKGLLSEILALVPVTSEPIDSLKHQGAIGMYERLDRLSRRDCLHRSSSFPPMLGVPWTDTNSP